MECTKGKLKQGKSNTLLYINSVNFGDVLVGGLPHEECEANAKELVRRWNAFEKDGLVDKLMAAAQMGLNSVRGIKNLNHLMECSIKNEKRLDIHIEQIEAAIAKAKS